MVRKKDPPCYNNPPDYSQNNGFSIPPEADAIHNEMNSFASHLAAFEAGSADLEGSKYADLPLPAWEFGPNDIRDLRTALLLWNEHSNGHAEAPLVLPFLSLNHEEKAIELVAAPIEPPISGELSPALHDVLSHTHAMTRFLRSGPGHMDTYRNITELLKALHVFQQKSAGIQTLRRHPFEPLRASAAANAIRIVPSESLYAAIAPGVISDPLTRKLLAVRREFDSSFEMPDDFCILEEWLQEHQNDAPFLGREIAARQKEVTQSVLDHFLEWLDQYGKEQVPLVSIRPPFRDGYVFGEEVHVPDYDLAIVPPSEKPGNEGKKE